MGGESTQIAYQFAARRPGDAVDLAADLFCRSFLSFGAKEAQLRFEAFLLSNREAFRDAADSRADRLHVPNPCNHRGFLARSPAYPALPHEGTGNVPAKRPAHA